MLSGLVATVKDDDSALGSGVRRPWCEGAGFKPHLCHLIAM